MLQARWAKSDIVGTFARVWLARLATPGKEDTKKVFALKILRKVDGNRALRLY